MWGVPLAAVGAYLFITRLMDVVTDPLMGYISDPLHARDLVAAGHGSRLPRRS